MGTENKSWFARNRGFVFGFAVAIAVLNIVILLLLPQQTTVSLDQTVTEYRLAEESYAAEHTVQLTGTLSQSAVSKLTFSGTLCISGVEGLEEPVELLLTREDGHWTGYFHDEAGQAFPLSAFGLYAFEADKTMGDILICLLPDEQQFLAPGAATRTAALSRLYTYYPAYRTK